jgi:hypothetical protein
MCDRHSRILFVKLLDQGTAQFSKSIEIPFGKWENWDWYIRRIEEATGIPAHRFRVTFAGLARSGTQRHSGLQNQSSIFCIVEKEKEIRIIIVKMVVENMKKQNLLNLQLLLLL